MLLYQPVEENRSGAIKVLKDRSFAEIASDYALSLHNFPSLPLGQAVIEADPMNCASCGVKITLKGRTVHASQPESGVSPAFGIAPVDTELWVTLRTQKDGMMADLVARTEGLVGRASDAFGLEFELSIHDIFRHCENDTAAAEIERAALVAENVPLTETELPMRGSEDFRRFGSRAKAEMFLLGSGLDTANLHNPDFDFPDELIPVGARVFSRVIRSLCTKDA